MAGAFRNPVWTLFGATGVRLSPAQLFSSSNTQLLGGMVPFGRNEAWLAWVALVGVAPVGRHTGRVTRMLAEWPDSDSA